MVVVSIATTILITSLLRCLIRDYWLLCFAFCKVINETATIGKDGRLRTGDRAVCLLLSASCRLSPVFSAAHCS